MFGMFEDSGKKICIVASVIAVIGIIVSVIAGFSIMVAQDNPVLDTIIWEIQMSFLTEDSFESFDPDADNGVGLIKFLAGILIAGVGSLISWVLALFIYGYGEMIDNTTVSAFNSKVMATDIDAIKEKMAPYPQQETKQTKKHMYRAPATPTASPMPDYAHSSNQELTTVVLPETVTSVGYAAYSGCENLKKVTISRTVRAIGGCAFSGCVSLTEVTIPDSVTSIGAKAFQDCPALLRINYEGTMRKWEAIPKGNKWFPESTDSVVYCSDGRLLIHEFVPEAKTVASPVLPLVKEQELPKPQEIPPQPETVPQEAPEPVVEEVLSPEPDSAKLTLPDGVTTVGENAFKGNATLTEITLPQGVATIGEEAFFECTNLNEVTLPDSVTVIGRKAFYGCASLSAIHYQGTVEQWRAIKKEAAWNANTSVYKVHCINGTLMRPAPQGNA